VILAAAMGFGLSEARAAGAEQGGWLITPEEAAQPAAPEGMIPPPSGKPFDIGRDAPDTGPIIDLVKPEEGSSRPAPMEVLVRFTPRSAPVDLSTLAVSVVKLISIDITDRVRPYTSTEGINIPDAKLPSGKHTVRISVGDAEGGTSRKQLTIIVP
jgi:hypothetical protein